jgi:hypothetical protein
MDTLKQTVHTVVAGYAGRALNGYSYLTESADGNLLTVVTIARQGKQHQTGVGIIVRIVGEQIIIERDQTDKMVVDALVQAGVPREQIILAYAGEMVPELANL